MANPRIISAQIVKIQNFGVNTILLKIKCHSKFPRMKSGQFLHFALDEYDYTYWPDSRPFSISGINGNRTELTILYSVKGVFTERMLNEIKPDSNIFIKGPLGDFIVSEECLTGFERIFFIAGGTGISPFMPFLENYSGALKINLIYGVRHYLNIPFFDVLERLKENTNFNLDMYIEDIAGIPGSIKGSFDIRNDSLDICAIDNKYKFDEHDKIYLAGPPNMINSFSDYLIQRDISEENIIIDEWS